MKTTPGPNGTHIHTFSGEEVAQAMQELIAREPLFWQYVLDVQGQRHTGYHPVDIMDQRDVIDASQPANQPDMIDEHLNFLGY